MDKLLLDKVHVQLSKCNACIHGRVLLGRPVCEADEGREIRYFEPTYACVKGYWKASDQAFMYGLSEPRVMFDPDSKTVWLTKADPGLMETLDATYKRIHDAPLRWDLNGKRPPDVNSPRERVPAVPSDPERAKARSYWESLSDLAGKAVQMAQVVTSGTAPDEVTALRRESCASCPARKVVGEDAFCSDCGCGTKPWAKLDKKLTYAYLPCPRRRAGFSNALPPP